MEKCTNITENLVKVTFLLKKILNSWFDGIFFQWDVRVNFSFFHTALIMNDWQELPWIQHYLRLDFTEFFVKLWKMQNNVFSSQSFDKTSVNDNNNKRNMWLISRIFFSRVANKLFLWYSYRFLILFSI